MAIPSKLYVAWSVIDPSLAHGGIPGELGEFVGPDLGDNTQTQNSDLKDIFTAIMTTAASISMAPEANKEGPPSRRIVEETLQAMNFIMERVVDRTITASTKTFEWCHAVPPNEEFRLRPVRFPLRQAFADRVIHFLLGTLVETAEMNRNANHAMLNPSTAKKILEPLFHVKSLIAKDYFDVEPYGEITMDEMVDMMAGVKPIGPEIVPPSESANLPSTEDVNSAMDGVNMLQWYPSAEEWVTFGRKEAAIYKPERIWQPEGAIQTTEDVANEQTTPAGSRPPSVA